MRGKHRARPRCRTAKAFATFCAATLLAGSLAGPAAAGEPGLPSPVIVDTGDINRVYGQIDHLAYVVSEEVEDQTPTIQTDMLNKVWGVVQDPTGVVQAGVTVILELLPSDGYDPLPGGSQVMELARTVTDSLGNYGITVPTTDEVLAEAEYLNGTVNMMLTAVKYQATQTGLRAYLGAGAIYSAMVAYGPGVGGVAMAPVNVGAMTIEEVKAMTGLEGLAETPGNDPDDPNTVQVDRPDIFVAGTGEIVGSVPADAEPYVETPSSMTNTHVQYPPDFPEIPVDFAKDDSDGGDTGDDRCKRPKNQGRWHVDAHQIEYRWQPVGEVHSVPGTNVTYVYAERANTRLGAAVKVESKPWKVSGGTNVTNDGGADADTDVMFDSFARHVVAEFVYHYTRKTWCPDGYDEENGPRALHMQEISGKSWAGGLNYGTRDISGRDRADERDRALAEGRAGTLRKNGTFTKTKGKTYKYTADVSAFGVGLNAESVNDVSHKMVLKGGSSRASWTMFGDVTVPPEATNHAVNVFFSPS